MKAWISLVAMGLAVALAGCGGSHRKALTTPDRDQTVPLDQEFNTFNPRPKTNTYKSTVTITVPGRQTLPEQSIDYRAPYERRRSRLIGCQ
jgi:hypothetical protein